MNSIPSYFIPLNPETTILAVFLQIRKQKPHCVKLLLINILRCNFKNTKSLTFPHVIVVEEPATSLVKESKVKTMN